MSRTNVYTLIATALLGVLWYIILQFAEDVHTAARSELSDTLSATPRTKSVGPTLSDRADLQAFLRERGVEADRVLEDTARWRRERGFIGSDNTLGITPVYWPVPGYEPFDDDDLRALSESGDLIATQILASHILSDDPFAALDLYETAAAQGSIFALIQIGSLHETFGNTALDKLTADQDYLKRLGQIRSNAPAGSLSIDAFAYTVAAIRDGGISIVDNELLGWLLATADAFSPEQEDLACELSSEKLLAYGTARRERGLRPITTRPPPVFGSVPDLPDRLPCGSTAHPIVSLFDLSACSVEQIENHRGEPVDLYICQN